jgi:cytochrome b
MNQPLIKVWDLPLRIFHWLLVVSFFTAYLSEDDFMTIHSYAGYTILALLSFRIFWGILGPEHARFTDFVYKPATTIQYTKQVFLKKAKRYLGHNPAGAAMVFMLLTSLLVTTLSGVATYATEEGLGPLVSLMNASPNYIFDAVEDIHEFFANFTLALVFIHVAGVIASSILHKENLIHSMFTGYKKL